MTRHFPKYSALALLCASLFGCKTNEPLESGTCTVAPSATLDCSVKRSTDGVVVPASDAALVGYFCTGKARPDADPDYVDGMPRGLVCDDKGLVEGQGHGYCCSETVADCAYNPVANCDDDTYTGFQCWGTRPDFINPSLYCRQGVLAGLYTEYCCRDIAMPKPIGAYVPSTWCGAGSDSACTQGLDSWTCPENRLPTSEEIRNSGSRSDFYAPMCSAMGAPAGGAVNYCCFTPKLPPDGASCVGHPKVPNCGYGRFGFACFGPDKPSDYHTPMVCNDPPVAGSSIDGYAAQLYCCDYDLTLAKSATP